MRAFTRKERDARRELRALVGRVDVVRLEPSDVLVVQGGYPTQEQLAHLAEGLAKHFPASKIVILADGRTLSVFRPPPHSCMDVTDELTAMASQLAKP